MILLVTYSLCREFCDHFQDAIASSSRINMLKTFDELRDLDILVEGGEPRGSSSIPGSLRLRRGAAKWLMPGARSKRCRQARPLTRLGRLAERERPGRDVQSSMQDQVALGALALTQSCQGRHRPRPWLAVRLDSLRVKPCCDGDYSCLHHLCVCG